MASEPRNEERVCKAAKRLIEERDGGPLVDTECPDKTMMILYFCCRSLSLASAKSVKSRNWSKNLSSDHAQRFLHVHGVIQNLFRFDVQAS